MPYFAKIEGHYIKDYTFDAERFNEMIESGSTISEILTPEKKPDPLERLGSLNRFYYLYEYEVDGVNYVRADRKASHRKDRKLAITERLGYTYEVTYDVDNPGTSTIGQKISGPVDSSVELAKASLIIGIISCCLCVFLLPSLILGPIGIVKGVKSLKMNKEIGHMAGIGVLISSLSIFFGLGIGTGFILMVGMMIWAL